MSKTTVVTLVGLGAAAVLVVYASLAQTRVECEVWMDYGGGSEHRTAASANRQDSVRSAVTSACATLSGDMADRMRCERTPPARVECRDR